MIRLGYEGVDPIATIETVKPSTTEFRIACPTGIDTTECGWGPGLEYSIVSGTLYQASFSYDTFSMSFGCDYNTKAAEMTCTASTSIGDEETETPQTAVFSGSEVAFMTATIVEGANLLSGAASATPAPTSSLVASTVTSMASSGSPTASGSATARSQASSSGSLSSSSASSPESTGAAPHFAIEGSILLVLAGAAALNAW